MTVTNRPTGQKRNCSILKENVNVSRQYVTEGKNRISRLNNEVTVEQLRVSTTPKNVRTPTLDQLEEWMKENPIPYINNDKFSQEGIFDYWTSCLLLSWKTA